MEINHTHETLVLEFKSIRKFDGSVSVHLRVIQNLLKNIFKFFDKRLKQAKTGKLLVVLILNHMLVKFQQARASTLSLNRSNLNALHSKMIISTGCSTLSKKNATCCHEILAINFIFFQIMMLLIISAKKIVRF